MPPSAPQGGGTYADVGISADGIAGAQAGSEDGYDYWNFDDLAICRSPTDPVTIYCFENPYREPTLYEDLRDWEIITPRTGENIGVDGTQTPWDVFAADCISRGRWGHFRGDCYICGCYRATGCFAPGVKITMADDSLRNIEEVRAGDIVRSAVTGAPVKVAQVIEGPEPLPLIRFGFEGTTVTTSQAHAVLTGTGLRAANQLTRDDSVFDAQGVSHPLTILETLPVEEGQRVINVVLDAASSDDDKRLLISDGIVTGDLVLQGLLKERR